MSNLTDVYTFKDDVGKNLYRKKTYYTLVIEQDVLAKDKDEADAKFSDHGGINHSKITKDISILDKEREYYVNKYGDPNAFQFEIEPINKYITPKYLVNKSIEILINKINNLLSNIKSSDEVKILKVLENTYKFIIENEDDTLGNVIQSFIHDKYVRNNDTIMDNISCKYCGYICPHPLKNLLEIQITLENQTDESIFKDFLQTNCLLIIDKLQDIKTEWNIFVEKK